MSSTMAVIKADPGQYFRRDACCPPGHRYQSGQSILIASGIQESLRLATTMFIVRLRPITFQASPTMMLNSLGDAKPIELESLPCQISTQPQVLLTRYLQWA